MRFSLTTESNNKQSDKGRTIRKVIGKGGGGGGGRPEVGDFLAAGIFFRYKILCMNFF